MPDNDDDVLFRGEHFIIRAMTKSNGRQPAKEWFDGLDEPGKGRFLAAAKILENTLMAGRPPAGRAGAINTSREDLWELRVTPKGGTPPHLRVAYLRERKTLWAATGFKKETNELDRQDIRNADSVAADWRRARERE